jgi:hypothetical protein
MNSVFRHAGLDPASRRRPDERRGPCQRLGPDFYREPWIPAGVYPVLVGATLRGDPHRDAGPEWRLRLERQFINRHLLQSHLTGVENIVGIE